MAGSSCAGRPYHCSCLVKRTLVWHCCLYCVEEMELTVRWTRMEERAGGTPLIPILKHTEPRCKHTLSSHTSPLTFEARWCLWVTVGILFVEKIHHHGMVFAAVGPCFLYFLFKYTCEGVPVGRSRFGALVCNIQILIGKASSLVNV